MTSPLSTFSIHPSSLSFHFSILSQSAAIVYSKANGAPLTSFTSSPLALLAGDALSSASLLTFFLWWALAHNYCHLYS